MPLSQRPNEFELQPFLMQAFRGQAVMPEYGDHLPQELLIAYAAEELDRSERMTVAAHLNSCGLCFEALSDLRAAWDRLSDRLSAALPQPDQLLERAQKNELFEQLKGFLNLHRPQELEVWGEIWELLAERPLREIAHARPQPVRGATDDRIAVAVAALLATILEREHARSLGDIPPRRLGELIEHHGTECGLSAEWSGRLRSYLLGKGQEGMRNV